MTPRLFALPLLLMIGSNFQVAMAQTREWGALAFTPDGTYATASRMSSMSAADGKVASECARLGHGDCQVTHFPGDVCVALATYVGTDPSKRNRHSRYGVGVSLESAQRLALSSCSPVAADCEIKVAFCGDGRTASVDTTDGPEGRVSPSRQPSPVEPRPQTGMVTPRRESSPQLVGPGGMAPEYYESSGNYGAIAFTADGSWATAWKKPSQAEAEADVAKRCAKFGRGGCEVVGFTGDKCVGLATFIGRSGRTNWKLSFSAGATTGPDAQRAAMDRCNSDSRTRGQCQLRTMVCGDGR